MSKLKKKYGFLLSISNTVSFGAACAFQNLEYKTQQKHRKNIKHSKFVRTLLQKKSTFDRHNRLPLLSSLLGIKAKKQIRNEKIDFYTFQSKGENYGRCLSNTLIFVIQTRSLQTQEPDKKRSDHSLVTFQYYKINFNFWRC